MVPGRGWCRESGFFRERVLAVNLANTSSMELCHRGVCMPGACVMGVCLMGGACLGVCMAGGMCGRGVCAWGACMLGGVCPGGMCVWGAFMTCMSPLPSRCYGIRSMSGWYASYWNTYKNALQ